MNNDNGNGRWVHPEDRRSVQNGAQRPNDPNSRRPAPQSGRPNASQSGRPTPAQSGGHPQRARAHGAPRTKKRSSVFGARLALFAVFFVLLVALIVVLFACSFFSTPEKPDSSMKITYGSKTIKVDENTAYHDSKLYLSFSRIAEYLELSRTGDADSARFVFASADSSSEGDGEEYVEFYRDETKAFVSGTEIRMTSPAYFTDYEVYIPAEFVKLYMIGLKVDENTSNHTVTVAREVLAETDENGDHLEAEVTLALKATVAPKPVDIGDISVDAADVEFITDLSEYEQYMNPADDSDFLVLVNKTNTVGADFAPEDLIDVVNTRSDRAARQMRFTAEKALEALYIEMAAAGYTDVSVTSAYRPYSEQEGLYSSYVQSEMAAGLSEEEAIAKVDTYSARAGTSEHQTGLCCDMHNLPSADQSFADQPVYSWLRENAWKFGFIERFPLGKEDVTGYSFEPWHYRFVGRRAAAQIHERGITLEEYLAG